MSTFGWHIVKGNKARVAKPHLLNEKQFLSILVIVTFEFSLCILYTCIFVVVVSFYKLLTGAVFGPSKLLGDTHLKMENC